MKLEELLRHVADNIENGRDVAAGLLFNGSKIRENSVDDMAFAWPEQYTLAPRMVRINGIDVKAGMSEAPSYDEPYYYSDTNGGREGFKFKQWQQSSADVKRLSMGMVFEYSNQGKEDALAMAKAMLIREEV